MLFAVGEVICAVQDHFSLRFSKRIPRFAARIPGKIQANQFDENLAKNLPNS